MELESSLARLMTFFSAIPDDGVVPELLRPLLGQRDHLNEPDFRVVFFGSAKTGKSSLIGNLLGLNPLLAQEALKSKRILELRYGSDTESPPFMAKETTSGSVDRIAASVQAPTLQEGVVIVDTPGVGIDENRDAAVRSEIAYADLGVMVLSADKVLSSSERELAAWANTLLQGSVVYVVNRMDLIETSEREEVVEWARMGLKGMGNDLVGSPTLVTTSAVADGTGERMEPRLGGLADIFQRATSPEARRRIQIGSRVGLLKTKLRTVESAIKQETARASRRVEDERRAVQERTMTERTNVKRGVAAGRLRLKKLEQELPAMGRAFVRLCVEETCQDSRLEEAKTSVPLDTKQALESYVGKVNELTATAFGEVPVTPRTVDAATWIFRIEVELPKPGLVRGVSDAGRRITQPLDGGRAGQEIGAALGDWIGRSILREPAEGQAISKRVEIAALQALASIQPKIEGHIQAAQSLAGPGRVVLRLMDSSFPQPRSA